MPHQQIPSLGTGSAQPVKWKHPPKRHYYRGAFARWTLRAEFAKQRRIARSRAKARAARAMRRRQRMRA